MIGAELSVLAERTMLEDDGLPTPIEAGTVLDRSMLCAVDLRTARVIDEAVPSVQLQGALIGRHFSRFICDARTYGTLPLFAMVPPAVDNRANFEVRAYFLLMWGYEVEIFASRCSTYNLRVLQSRESNATYQLEGQWLDVLVEPPPIDGSGHR